MGGLDRAAIKLLSSKNCRSSRLCLCSSSRISGGSQQQTPTKDCQNLRHYGTWKDNNKTNHGVFWNISRERVAIAAIAISVAASLAWPTNNKNNIQSESQVSVGDPHDPQTSQQTITKHCDKENNNESIITISSRSYSSFPFYGCLLEQCQLVKYDESRDSKSITSDNGYSKPSGLPGLACRHCLANFNFQDQSIPYLHRDACIFPQDRRSLARDFAAKLFDHVSKCPMCPQDTKKRLLELKNQHNPVVLASKDAATTQLQDGKQQQERQQQQQQQQLSSRRSTRRSTLRRSFTRDERLFFRELWHLMGHKEIVGEHRPFKKYSTQQRQL